MLYNIIQNVFTQTLLIIPQKTANVNSNVDIFYIFFAISYFLAAQNPFLLENHLGKQYIILYKKTTVEQRMIIAVSGEFGDDLTAFVYFHIERERILQREKVNTPPGGKDALIKQFLGLNIDLLISGKIAPDLELALNEAGISVISGINDNCDAVIKAYMDGTLDF